MGAGEPPHAAFAYPANGSLCASWNGDGRSLKNGCALYAANDLRIPERLMLFCLSSGTDWERAGITHATAQQMLVRGLIDREGAAGRFRLTPLGRSVFTVLLKPAVDEQDG
jgi:hypothetical protein